MKKEIPPNMRGVRTGFVVTVCEGLGTVESISREVQYVYVYDNKGIPMCIGALDPIGEIKHWQQSI
jgi:hypothetical protein